MKKIMDEQLIYEILSVVEEINEGKVDTYGQIASLAGRKKCKSILVRFLAKLNLMVNGTEGRSFSPKL